MGTLRRSDLPHQIRIGLKAGSGTRIWVGCVCGAPPIASCPHAADHWAIYNTLAHDEARGPFERVDALSGRPTGVYGPAPRTEEHAVRAWAVAAGYPVAGTGRVSDQILAAYAEAHDAGGEPA